MVGKTGHRARCGRDGGAAATCGHDLRGRLRIAVSLVLFVLESSFIFQIPSVLFTDADFSGAAGYYPAAVAAVSAAAAYLFGTLLYLARRVEWTSSVVWNAGCVVSCVGWALCLLGKVVSATESLSVIGFAVLGVGSALWLPALVKGLARVGACRSMVYAAGAYCVTALFGSVLTVLEAGVALVVNIVLCACMTMVFPGGGMVLGPRDAVTLGRKVVSPASPLPAEPQTGRPEAEQPETDHAPVCRFPLKLGCVYLALGICSGLVGAGVEGLPFGVSGLVEGILTSVASCVLVILCAFVLKLDFDTMVFGVGLPVLGLCLAGMALSATDWTVAILTQETANLFVEALTWGVTSYLVLYLGASATWVSLAPSLMLFLGQLAGIALGTWSMGAGRLGVVLVLTMFVVMLASIWLQRSHGDLSGWGEVKPPVLEGSGPAPLDLACARLASSFGLTAREEEVLKLLAMGRTKHSIASRLTISEDTAKTHILRVYRKLDVHSQQDLMDMVERKQEGEPPEDRLR